MERMSMENAEDVVKESEPYGIDVSLLQYAVDDGHLHL